jgi:hypothetical protein
MACNECRRWITSQLEIKTMSAIIPVENNNAIALSETPTRDIVSSKGNVIGREFIFNLGDTKAMKETIAAQNPTWSRTKVSNHLAEIRRNGLAASRLEAAAFLEYQIANGNVPVKGQHRDSGKSVLRFEKAEVKETKSKDKSKEDFLREIAANIAKATGMSIDQAMNLAKGNN